MSSAATDKGCSTGCCSESHNSSQHPVNCEVRKNGNEIPRIPHSCIPLPLPDDIVKKVSDDARDYALLHGAGMRYKESFSLNTLSMAPFFLLPTPFPRRDFETVYAMQPLINLLMHRVAHDFDFLEKCLSNTILVDDFTRKLWDIYTTVKSEGIRQPTCLSLLRCDVILDTPSCATSPHNDQFLLCNNTLIADKWTSKMLYITPPKVLCCSSPKQVEVNTIASSFAALADNVTYVQKYVLKLLRRPDLIANLPENKALQNLCSAMIEAWKIYNREEAIILFIVEDVSYNICDQRFHEYEILNQRPDLRVLRRTLPHMQKAVLDSEGRLWIDNLEVAVVYFRSGYDPSGYSSDLDWQARLNIERSLAIKCPSVYFHLAGTKKVQQELAAPGALLRFLSTEEADTVSQLFTGLYTLDMGPEGDIAVEMAMKDPDRFVLKPQREGGGNNIYGQDIKTILERIGSTREREAYILMDRIRAPIQTNYLVSPHKEVELAKVISELGIFGAILGTKDEIHLNQTCGHMLRSKLSSNNEGGVASGNGALDSVLLVD